MSPSTWISRSGTLGSGGGGVIPIILVNTKFPRNTGELSLPFPSIARMAPMPSRPPRGESLGSGSISNAFSETSVEVAVVRCQSFVNDHEFGADQIRNAKIIQSQLPEGEVAPAATVALFERCTQSGLYDGFLPQLGLAFLSRAICS